MSIGPRIRRAKFGGAVFYVTHSSVTSGRKTVIHDFVNSRLRNVEDMGKQPPVYEFSAFIKGSRREYEKTRDKLMAALTSGESKTLWHPFRGAIQNCIALPYTFSESITTIGIGEFTLRFTISTTAPVPVSSTGVFGANPGILSAIGAIGDAIDAAFDAMDMVADNIDSITGVLTDVQDLMTDSVARFAGAMSSVSRLKTAVGALSDPAAFLNASVGGLYQVLLPGKPVSEAHKQIATAAPTPAKQMELGKALYNGADTKFKGDPTTSYVLPAGDTSTRKARRALVADLINSHKAMSLAGAFAAASKIKYKTLADAQKDADWLSSKWAELSPLLSASAKSALQGLRASYLKIFKGLSVSLPKQTTVPSKGSSTALMSYQYYGSLKNEQVILDLNAPKNPGGLGDTTIILGE